MENHLISVVVPVYNVENYLHASIESVINQTYKFWELILINDGSTDNCPSICDEYATKDKRIKVIHKKNEGVSKARNIAIDICKGEYITFLDSDDFWHEAYIETLLMLSLNYDADISQCNFTRGTENIFPQLKSRSKIKVFDNHSVFLKGYAKIIVWAKLYKRYLLEDIKMPEGKFFEDDFTTWKWYFSAKKIVVSNQALYYYTENQQSTMSGHSKQPSLDFIEAYNERITYFRQGNFRDMEDYSRAQLCKSMVLISANPFLSKTQKEIVDKTFYNNWRKIKYSKNVLFPFRILFFMFRFLPKLTLVLLNKKMKNEKNS